MSEQVRMPKADWVNILEAVRAKNDSYEELTSSQVPQVIEGMEYYRGSMLGKDSRALEMHIPFCPDMVAVYSTNPCVNVMASTYRGFLADLRSSGQHLCHVALCSEAGSNSTSAVPVAMGIKTFIYENGVLRFELPAEVIPTVLWRKNVRYTVVAARFSREDMRSLITEQIELLPEGSSGTLTYNAERIYENFSAAEWEELISTKPNWTITLN